MTRPTVKPTTSKDIVALKRVLEETGLFPGEALPELLSPAMSGAVSALWFTCHVENQPVGFCFADPEELAEGTWNMRALAVRPDLQGNGHGSALVEAVEQRLRTTGQHLLIVDTSSTGEFEQARRFYAHMGYEEEARIRDFWAPGDDKITFRKAL